MGTRQGVALITGASAGLGACYARTLASSMERLVLVARRLDRLEALQRELESSGCEVDIVAADLATGLGRAAVIEALRQKGPVTLLINNAGFSTLGALDELDIESQQAMVDVHITATLALCRAAIPFMKQAGGGAIINLSSLAAFSAMPRIAVYCASKAFLNNFSQGLQAEVTDHNIRVQALCPGYTRTEFHSRDSFEGFDADSIPDDYWMTSEQVVAESLAALETDEVIVVPGEHNRAMLAKFQS